MPKVSVVIPVYNTGSLLDRALESVTRQTLTDIEIICVDDCSTDGSLFILNDWAQRDSRVRVIALPDNGGVSRARNTGIDESRGEYIYFLDSDDWIDDDYLEAMYTKALETGQAVVVNANYVKEYEDAGKKPERENWGFSAAGFYSPAIVQSHMLCVMWVRLYKRSYLIDNQLLFPDIPSGEDILFTSLAEVLQPRSYVFLGPYHHYWQRTGSLFHQKSNGFYYVQSYRMLYDELVARGIPLGGLKLFHCGMIEVDSQEKFDVIRSFAQLVNPYIQQHPEYYTGHDLLLLAAVLSCPDYQAFLAQHHPNIAVEYLRAQLKMKSSFPAPTGNHPLHNE